MPFALAVCGTVSDRATRLDRRSPRHPQSELTRVGGRPNGRAGGTVCDRATAPTGESTTTRYPLWHGLRPCHFPDRRSPPPRRDMKVLQRGGRPAVRVARSETMPQRGSNGKLETCPTLPLAPPRFLHLRRRDRLPLQLGDAVAQLRGPLELQVRRRRQHLARAAPPGTPPSRNPPPLPGRLLRRSCGPRSPPRCPC